jgi:hypothetical protein
MLLLEWMQARGKRCGDLAVALRISDSAAKKLAYGHRTRVTVEIAEEVRRWTGDAVRAEDFLAHRERVQRYLATRGGP